MRRAIALIAVFIATGWGGCGQAVKIDPPPKIVTTTVEVPVSLCEKGGGDCELLRDCYNEPVREQTYDEGKRLANLRDASIAECNKRWAKVRKLQPAAAPSIERKDK